MNRKNFKGSIVILSCFVALGLFFLVFSFWNDTKYNQPLSEYLESQEQVIAYEIEENDNDGYNIEIELEYHPYLNRTIMDVEEEIKTILDDKKNELVFKYDEKNQNLQNAFYDIHFILYEAKERGNYSEMQDEIDKILESHELNHYQIHILTDQRLLVQMEDDDGYLLYLLDNNSKDSNQGSA
ncbi:hypothetical protein [Natranaerofaba carboxydovora]|uniref:hypothetical protein n=1 Tax=Natranaerofaba carboxydovora TaxID=2742683 RepID=UPI001F13F8CC|nr:hypothetical protein [Natranaerofaba carboxydovora]UMZ73473.1 hypothetical protein ACONDI_01027 [Natranaerofaba carboxydovora]